MKKNYLKIFLGSLLVLIVSVTSIFVFNSCQKDLGVDPVTTDRVLTGTIIENGTNKPIQGAIIKVYPPFENSKPIQCISDAQGKFQCHIPVIPQEKNYRYEVTHGEYERVVGSTNCNCNILLINPNDNGYVRLKSLSCGVSYYPNSIDFPETTIPLQELRDLVVYNPTLSDVKIDSIYVDDKQNFILDYKFTLPYTLKAKDTLPVVKVVFNPQKTGYLSSNIVIKTNCSSPNDIRIIPITGRAISDSCGIEIKPLYLLFDTIAVGTKSSQKIIIKNPYDKIIKIDSLTFNYNDIFSISPNIKGQFLQKNESRELTVTLDAKYSKIPLNDTLKIFTDCKKTVAILPIKANIYGKSCRIEVLDSSKYYNKQLKRFRLFYSQELKYRIHNNSIIPIKVNRIQIIEGPANINSLIELSPIVPPSRTINAMDFLEFRIKNKGVISGEVEFKLIIETDGSCDSSIIPIQLYQYGMPSTPSSMSKWSYNPAFADSFNCYRGFYFDPSDILLKSKLYYDSTEICPNDQFTLFPWVHQEYNQEGFRQTHIRFDGITQIQSVNYAHIKGRKIKYMGNSTSLAFEVASLKNKLISLKQKPWETGCAASPNDGLFKDKDIFAVKTGYELSGQALEQVIYVYVYSVGYGADNKEILTIQFIEDFVESGTLK